MKKNLEQQPSKSPPGRRSRSPTPEKNAVEVRLLVDTFSEAVTRQLFINAKCSNRFASPQRRCGTPEKIFSPPPNAALTNLQVLSRQLGTSQGFLHRIENGVAARMGSMQVCGRRKIQKILNAFSTVVEDYLCSQLETKCSMYPLRVDNKVLDLTRATAFPDEASKNSSWQPRQETRERKKYFQRKESKINRKWSNAYLYSARHPVYFYWLVHEARTVATSVGRLLTQPM